MDWQLALTCAAIILAGAHLLMRGRRALLGKPSGCSGGCGCVKPKPQPGLIAPEELVLRRRAPQAGS